MREIYKTDRERERETEKETGRQWERQKKKCDFFISIIHFPPCFSPRRERLYSKTTWNPSFATIVDGTYSHVSASVITYMRIKYAHIQYVHIYYVDILLRYKRILHIMGKMIYPSKNWGVSKAREIYKHEESK